MYYLSDPIFSLHQVVQKKDSHDYRCLFRVCFIPRDPMDLLQDDPSTFEYLFLQVRGAYSVICNAAFSVSHSVWLEMSYFTIQHYCMPSLAVYLMFDRC